MKLQLILIFVFCSLGFGLIAQQDVKNEERRKENFDKFQAKRVEYITNEMDLTPEEAIVFWPLCNELQKKKFELNRALRKEIRGIRQLEKTGEKASTADYDRVVTMGLDIKEKEAELEKTYIRKFKEVISSEKIFRYQRAEQHFAREIFPKFEGKKKIEEEKSQKIQKSQKLQKK